MNGNDLDRGMVDRLLDAMQANSKPVKPAMLGIIGREHFKQRFAQLGCEMESFDYRKSRRTTDGMPWVVETAFGWCRDADGRRLVTGVNWSPGIVNPFRALGARHEPRHDPQPAAGRPGRAGDLRPARRLPAGRVHRPRQVGGGGGAMKADAIIGAVEGVTKKWAKQRKAEERAASAGQPATTP